MILEVLGIVVLLASLALGSYLRYYPVINALNYGYEPTLYEMDPFLTYWVTKQLYENGLTYYTSLTPDNNITRVFWYPWGRDIPATELPALPYISLFTYYLVHLVSPGISLYEWLVYLPILFYIISVIGIYLTIRELTDPISAAISSLTASLMFIDRQVAGFTVKYGLGIAFIFISIYFHVRAVKNNSKHSALICGVLLGISALSWAGFNLLLAALLIQYALVPLIRSDVRNYFTLWLYEVIPLTLFIILAPSYYNGFYYLIHNAGVMIPLGTLVLLCGYLIHRISSLRYVRIKKIPVIGNPKLTYFILLVIFGLVGITALLTGFVGIGGKGLAAMGLSSMAGVLTGTIAQYRSAEHAEFITWGGTPLIISVIGMLYMFYRGFIRRDSISIFMLALNAISILATANVAYFFSYSNLVVAMVSGYIIGSIFTPREVISGIKRKLSWFTRALITVIMVLYVVAVILQGVFTWMPAYRVVVPTIISAGTELGINIPSWINMLNWVRNNTDKDAVIVAWWDYGYWISVAGERASVADGSTLNGSQIHLLAKALTSDEVTAAHILTKYFMIPPSKLYVATYEFFLVDDYNRRVYPGPLVLPRSDGRPIFIGTDGAKAISAMFRIAGVDIDKEVSLGGGDHVRIYRYTDNQRGITYSYVLPNWESSKITEALLYKMLLDGARTIWGTLGYSIYDAFTEGGGPIELNVSNMQLFKPAYISASRVTSSIYLVTVLYKFDYEAAGI